MAVDIVRYHDTENETIDETTSLTIVSFSVSWYRTISTAMGYSLERARRDGETSTT